MDSSIMVPDAPVSTRNRPTTACGIVMPAAVMACIRGVLIPTLSITIGPNGSICKIRARVSVWT